MREIERGGHGGRGRRRRRRPVVVRPRAQLLQHLGDDPRPLELQELIRSVDADGNGVIDFEEFVTIIALRSSHKHTGEDVLGAFRIFDEEGTGRLPIDRFRLAMKELMQMSEEELEELIMVATGGDEAADGIDYAAFVELMMSV